MACLWLAPRVALAQDDLLAPLAPAPEAPKPKAKPKKPKPVVRTKKPKDDDLLAPLVHPAKSQLLVRVAGGATDAILVLDGTAVGLLPDHAFDVSPGEHLVTVKRPGYAEYSQKVFVNEGATAELAASLQPAVVADRPEAEPGPTPKRDRPEVVDLTPVDRPADNALSMRAEASPPIYQRWYFWTGAAAVVAAGVVTAVVVSHGNGGLSPAQVCGGTCSYVLNGP